LRINLDGTGGEEQTREVEEVK
jgi:hypothetical protein